MRPLLVLLAVVACAATLLLRPVCDPIPDESLREFVPPIETRQDRSLYFATFQKRDGHWFQCKTWIARWGFS